MKQSLKDVALDRKRALDDVKSELEAAYINFPKMASPHEGYAILLEEVDELWDEIKKKQNVRGKALMRNEARQIAAMAIRFMVELT